MANYVLIVDLGNAANPIQYEALTRLMRDFGFTPRRPEMLRPAQFSTTSALPLRGLKQMVEARIKAELQTNACVEAYKIKQLLQLNTTGPARLSKISLNQWSAVTR